jgi:phage I-like protein
MTTSKLLNRESRLPGDGLYQIVPAGEFPISVPLSALPAAAAAELRNRAGKSGYVRVVQVVDTEALVALANSVSPDAELLVDYDHDSMDGDKSSRAAGWLTAPVAKADGLYAPIAWTARAEGEVKGREFRYLSPVFDDGNTLQHLGNNRFRVTRLLGAAVTNNPNMRTIKPLSNRAGDTGAEPETQSKTDTRTMKAIAQALGLPEDATEGQILAAIAAAQGKNTAAETEKTALANRVNELESEVAETRKIEAAALCARHGITDSGKREKLTASYLANREQTKALLGLLPEPAAKDGDKTALTNRYKAKSPDGAPNAIASAKDGDESSAFVNRARAIAKEKNICEEEAYGHVAAAEPALYAEYTAALTAKA